MVGRRTPDAGAILSTNISFGSDIGAGGRP